ncbi:outer membrane beta-barrel protein [uncultured Polaribacter sp.]|uniref:outer membrane beta-barrel protein n=1 Tax=uncultured Polaribacter sp. TaxID=174711 RepID=UPI00261F586C|nr:outer membrane beta-barrel protein [uncultured Polaribacter sp.]
MKYFTLISFLIIIQHLCGQSQKSVSIEVFKISGKVTDVKNQPIPNAHIVFTHIKTEKKLGVISNQDNGKFSIELISGEYIVQVTALGFLTYTEKYKILKNTILKDIVLKEKAEQLDEVVIKADLSKNIKHSATGMTINIQNDSLYKKMSTAEVLSLLPGVTVGEDGTVKLQGIPAKVTIDGKTQRMSSTILMMLLESMQGDQLKNIELINTPSAKYSGRVQKVIDINLKKERNDGLAGAVSSRVGNADFSIGPFVSINYKIGKFVFTGTSTPYMYSKISRSIFIKRQLLDNSLSFDEEQESFSKDKSSFNQFGIDYTITKKHSVSVGISLNNDNNDSNIDFRTNQFAFKTLTNQQLNSNINDSHNNSYTVDFGYRYDIGNQGVRLDFASSYGENKSDNNTNIESELIDFENDNTTFTNSRDNQDQDNTQSSSRIDFTMPLKDKKGKFEAGLKYDDLIITDANLFENFNTNTNRFEIDANFTNAFEYNEEVFTGYMSYNASFKKLKYSLGLRLEHVETQSFSKTTDQRFANTYTNFLPVIALKYMTNKKQTSTIGLSYRKGYELPPYVQLNPFETFVNSNTIKRGNPTLTQSLYHLFALSRTIKNKYFITLSANFYKNLFQTTQILEGDNAIISYRNLGTRSLYKASFNTTFKLYSWWRFNVNPMLNYSILKDGQIINEVFTVQASTVNTFTLPNSFRIGLTTIFSNGDSSGLDTPNEFIRVFPIVSLSKRFLKNKGSVRVSISDIFGVSNRNESNYILDDTGFSRRSVMQNPRINFNLSYRFSSGKKVNKKMKKTSKVNSTRF